MRTHKLNVTISLFFLSFRFDRRVFGVALFASTMLPFSAIANIISRCRRIRPININLYQIVVDNFHRLRYRYDISQAAHRSSLTSYQIPCILFSIYRTECVFDIFHKCANFRTRSVCISEAQRKIRQPRVD